MSRTDMITYGTTTASVGAGFLLGGPKWGWPLLIVGAVICILAAFKREKTKDSPGPHPQAVATSSPNISIKPVFINSPKQVQPQAQGSQEIAKPRPNVTFLRTGTVNVEPGLDGGLYEREYQTEMKASIACFRNEPVYKKKPSDADLVVASLVYRGPNAQEIGTGVSPACWLNSRLDRVDLAVGGPSHCVILIALARNGLLLAPYQRREEHQTDHRMLTLDAYPLSEPVGTIELRLLDEWNEMLLPPIVFDFSIADGSPRAILNRPCRH